MSRSSQVHFRVALLALCIVLAFSIVMVYSSSSVVALTNYNDPAYFVKRQILWMVIGFALMAITMHTDHRALADRRAVVGLLAVSLLLLAATLIPSVGKEINGARRNDPRSGRYATRSTVQL